MLRNIRNIFKLRGIGSNYPPRGVTFRYSPARGVAFRDGALGSIPNWEGA